MSASVRYACIECGKRYGSQIKAEHCASQPPLFKYETGQEVFLLGTKIFVKAPIIGRYTIKHHSGYVVKNPIDPAEKRRLLWVPEVLLDKIQIADQDFEHIAKLSWVTDAMEELSERSPDIRSVQYQFEEPQNYFGNGDGAVLVGEELERKPLHRKWKRHFVPENQLELGI